jgi:hypothetical protein
VNRDEVYEGAQEFGVDLGEHVDFIIAALREVAAAVGLKPIPWSDAVSSPLFGDWFSRSRIRLTVATTQSENRRIEAAAPRLIPMKLSVINRIRIASLLS